MALGYRVSSSPPGQDYPTPSLSLQKQDPEEEVASNSAFSPGCKLPPGKGEPRRKSTTQNLAVDTTPGDPCTRAQRSHPTDKMPPLRVQTLTLKTNKTASDPKMTPQTTPSTSLDPRRPARLSAPHWLSLTPPLPCLGKTQVSDPLCSALPKEPTPSVQGLGETKCLLIRGEQRYLP